jgi:hypothetical protein
MTLGLDLGRICLLDKTTAVGVSLIDMLIKSDVSPLGIGFIRFSVLVEALCINHTPGNSENNQL